MKALIVGSGGQLGHALQSVAPPDARVTTVDLPELDIVDRAGVLEFCRAGAPDVIFNAAAYTAVDKAESEPELAEAINVEGVRNLARAAKEGGAKLIHVSTDFVFDGLGTAPYKPDNQTSPVSVYGRTKRDGEIAVLDSLPETGLVVRTAWLYGEHGNNFVRTMLQLMSERDEIGVVADQRGTPTWATSLAETLWALAGQPGSSGTFHWTDGGQATWYEFAVAVQEEALALGILERAIPIRALRTEEYPTPARRPRYSVLDCSSTCELLGREQVDWRDNLRKMLQGVIV